MDDDWKEYKRNKPQQKLYKPGSGPLRRSGYGLDAKMNSYDVSNGPRGRDQHQFGSRSSVYEDDTSSNNKEHANNRQKKPEQPLYVPRSADCKPENMNDRHPNTSMRSDNANHTFNRRNTNNKLDKHVYHNSTGYRGPSSRRDRSFADPHNKDVSNNDVNYNRNYRQISEPRSMSPSYRVQVQPPTDRNRDSRSMETSAGRHNSGSVGKPPSGRRNSAGYPPDSPRPKYMLNLENLPPRLRKKFLEQSGHHSFDSSDHINRDKYENHSMQPQNSNNQGTFHHQSTSWSQTLPSRGRGRLRDNERFDRDKFINTYLKHYEVQNSRRSTPSNSYMNLYEPHSIDNSKIMTQTTEGYHNNQQQQNKNLCHAVSNKNGITNIPYNHKDDDHSKHESDSEPVSSSSTNLMDMTNLDWTEEVEKSMKLDDQGDSPASSPTPNLKSSSISQDTKSFEHKTEPRESKRSGRAKRRDKRSSSRGQKNEKKTEQQRNRRDSGQQEALAAVANIHHHHQKERERRDSGQQEAMAAVANIHHNNQKERERRDSSQQEALAAVANIHHNNQKERERRDSHKSNRSSTIGNSRDDLDRWRSVRSFSREQSAEGRIVSQCNSRDTSANRALSPRDNDGFRIPSAMPKNCTWTPANQKKTNGSWSSARTPSIERGRQSPAPSVVSTGGEVATEGGGGGRRPRRRNGRRRGRNAENREPPAPHPVPAGHTPAPTNMNWREEILESKKHTLQDRQDRHQDAGRNRLNSVQSDKSASEPSAAHPGLLILPQGSMPHTLTERGREGSMEAQTQKLLYDHHNPSKPIIVQTNLTKADTRMDRASTEPRSRGVTHGATHEDGGGAGEAVRAARHRPLLQEVDRADAILQTHTLRGPLALAHHWPDVTDTRNFLQSALQRLLMSDLKYCQADNVEHHFWKILYYNFIEVLRKSLTQVSAEEKIQIIKLINTIIEEGNSYFENLVQMLEKTYKFNVEDYINDNHLLPPKGLGYVGLALISVQKLYVFLGDLARYKEQVNETNNYAKSKFWYTKAQQINPKNGRPYNQLAILAIYARRKLDAVYYYMRSLMSSNPFHSARESLISLFDENRKKYEAAERKRRAVIEANSNSEQSESKTVTGRGLRREIWVRPSGGRTTTIQPDTRDDRLDKMSPVELNKNFITSYLHVHGKLVTKIGMETFHESAALMLRQFRALLQKQPLPTPSARLLQLTALNMFAVESTGSNDKGNEGGERSAWLECALAVSLLMFGALLERCCALLPEQPNTQQHADALLLLPAIKVWSDWMLCHSSVWNPPPSFDSFDVGSDNDPWDWLAKLMNILESLDDKSIVFESEMKEGYSIVRLPEDGSLAGFTPLMYMEPGGAWLRRDHALTHAHSLEHALRTRKLLFFGTEYLVGVEPPVLGLEYPADAPPRYVSVVKKTQPTHLPLQDLSEDSEEEEEDIKDPAINQTEVRSGGEGLAGADEATRRLLRRKEQLEVKRANMERRRQRMQELLRGSWVSVEVEVRPRWLVPDTNCFIDHLPLLQRLLAPDTPSLLVVPLVVVTELEGLSRCARVGPNAQAALVWLGAGGAAPPAGVRFATSRGSLLASRAFTAERESARATNDDRVLATAQNLQINITTEKDGANEEVKSIKTVKRIREVVLLTDDRNLRVKAIAADLPARDLPSFVEWAGLRDATGSAVNKTNHVGHE